MNRLLEGFKIEGVLSHGVLMKEKGQKKGERMISKEV